MPPTTTACRADVPAHLHNADVDPDLEQQLSSAAEDTPVEAVLVLRRNDLDAQDMTSPESLLQRVSGNEPRAATIINYLPRLGVLIVRAFPSIIRRLIAQPEVATASANRVEAGQPAAAGKEEHR
jgi:hypothetical protein